MHWPGKYWEAITPVYAQGTGKKYFHSKSLYQMVQGQTHLGVNNIKGSL